MADRIRIGNWLAPRHFVAFAIAAAIAVSVAWYFLREFSLAAMLGFDFAAVVFLARVAPLLAVHDPAVIRGHARENDANRTILLAITCAVAAVLLIAIAAEAVGRTPQPETKTLIVVTLALAWLFTNTVYALHYAHLAYGNDELTCAGIEFPTTEQPTYWDFVYFAFTLGMTFQTSDVTIHSAHIRRIVTGHCLAAFVFNIGVLAFTINVLGG